MAVENHSDMHDMTRAKCDAHFGDHNTLAADAFHGSGEDQSPSCFLICTVIYAFFLIHTETPSGYPPHVTESRCGYATNAVLV